MFVDRSVSSACLFCILKSAHNTSRRSIVGHPLMSVLSIEVIWQSEEYDSWTSSCGCIPGTSNKEDTRGQSPKMLEGFLYPTWPGNASGFLPREPRKIKDEDGGKMPGLPCAGCCHGTLDQDVQKMDEWI